MCEVEFFWEVCFVEQRYDGFFSVVPLSTSLLPDRCPREYSLLSGPDC